MSAGFIAPESRIAGRVVLAWIRAYTRDVTPEVAAERRAELESDVWEQVNDAELAGLAAGPLLLWRTARSVPADLAWRRAARSADSGRRAPLHIRWERSGLLGLMTLEALLLAAAMLGTIGHVLHGGGAGSLGPTTSGVLAALTAGLLLAVTGLGLLLRARTRWLAPVAVGLSGVILLLTGLPALAWISTTVAAFYYASPLMWTHPGWSDVSSLAVALVAIFHGAVLVAWFPGRPGRRGEETR